jgi:hypothetical protein
MRAEGPIHGDEKWIPCLGPLGTLFVPPRAYLFAVQTSSAFLSRASASFSAATTSAVADERAQAFGTEAANSNLASPTTSRPSRTKPSTKPSHSPTFTKKHKAKQRLPPLGETKRHRPHAIMDSTGLVSVQIPVAVGRNRSLVD